MREESNSTSDLFYSLISLLSPIATQVLRPLNWNTLISTTLCVRLQLILVSKHLLRELTIRSRRASPEGEIGQSLVSLLLNSVVRHDSQYATIDRIKQAIMILEVPTASLRLTVFDNVLQGSPYQHIRHSQTCPISLPGSRPELTRGTNSVESNPA